jgi:hypothetical protein
VPVIISLAKGIEAALEPVPHIITPTKMIHQASKSFLHLFSRTNICDTDQRKLEI